LALREAITVAVRHHLKVPPEMVLLGRSAMAVEGVVCRLDPELVLIEEAMPQAKKLLLRRFDPRRQARDLHRLARDYKNALTRLPAQTTHILQRLLDSRLSIDFVHRGYEKGLIEMDRSSNRISVSLIVSSLIVGSSLLVLSGRGPQVWGFPAFGIVGFLLAGAMGFTLAIMILRSGKI
jgi:ubiquinone biosynthesis protein